MIQPIRDTFAQVRDLLAQGGTTQPLASLNQRDQMVAAFRSDLVSLGIDTVKEGSIEAALAGLAIGMKILIQQGVGLAYVNHYVFICECVLSMLDSSDIDMSSFGDSDFFASLNMPVVQPEPVQPEPDVRFSCSKCGGSDAIVPAGWLHFCIPCASEAVNGGLAALRLARGVDIRTSSALPSVGGPEFNREAESAHAEEQTPQPLEGTGLAEAAVDAGVETAEAPTGGTVDTPLSPSWKEINVNDVAAWLSRRRRK
jgi:hypothetical protein